VEDATVTNRELASLIILGGLVLCVLVSSGRMKTAGSLVAALKLLAAPKVFVPLVFYVGWILVSLLPARSIGLWEPALWKPSVLWIAFSGLGLVFNLNEAISKPGFFKGAVIRTAEVTAVIEFFAALKSFPLWLEIPAQVLAFMFAGVAALARAPEQQPARHLANGYLAIFGVSALIWSVIAAIREWDGLDRRELLLDFMLPIWLTPAALVFVYVVAVYAAHQGTWKQLRIWNKESLWCQRLAIILCCNIRLGSLRALRGQALPALARSSGMSEAWSEVGAARERARKEAAEEKARKQRLTDNAGLKGTDKAGQQLDQREFETTRQALRWLATCQMGRYNKRGRYEPELLPVVEARFVRDGLPEDHGIELHVSKDGQSWYAYRETPSGRHFGIGAARGTPDQWLYDGEQAPTTFPCEHQWDQFVPGEHSVNWD
jgi:hypothetical protein